MVDKVSDKPGLALRTVYVIVMIVAAFTTIGGVDLTDTLQTGGVTVVLNMSITLEPFRECWDVTSVTPDAVSVAQASIVVEEAMGPPCAMHILRGTGEALIIMLASVVLYLIYRVSTWSGNVHSWRYNVEYVYDWVVFISASVAVGYAVDDYYNAAGVHARYVDRKGGTSNLTLDTEVYGPGFIMLCIALVSSGILAALSFKMNPWHRYHPAHHIGEPKGGQGKSELEMVTAEAVIDAVRRPKTKQYALVYV